MHARFVLLSALVRTVVRGSGKWAHPRFSVWVCKPSFWAISFKELHVFEATHQRNSSVVRDA